MKYKITKEELENTVNDCVSTSQVCFKLNIKPSGGNYQTLKKKYKEYNIDTSHFTGQAWNTGDNFKPFYNFSNKKKIDDILENKVTYSNTHNLRIRLFNEGLKEKKCEICDLSIWMDREIPLELHHKNGDRNDNSFDNLQILCSNCHGQTENYCSKNSEKYKARLNVNKIKIKSLKEIERAFKQRKVNRPSLDILLLNIKEFGYVGTGKKYGVSDNTIRKWIKNK